MARNAEKAMTTLARWRQSQLEAESGAKQRRPFLASDCNDLKEAEKWRLDIIREISKKVTQIQNAGLGEFRIRDLNDQINKLLRKRDTGSIGSKNWVEFTTEELVVRVLIMLVKKWSVIAAINTSVLPKICQEFGNSSRKNHRL